MRFLKSILSNKAKASEDSFAKGLDRIQRRQFAPATAYVLFKVPAKSRAV